jgi:uroporphyrinogen-III synthase
LDLVFGEFTAASFDVAVFGSGKAACAMGYFASLPWYSTRVSYVCFADTTVHSAGSNKIRSKHTSNDN